MNHQRQQHVPHKLHADLQPALACICSGLHIPRRQPISACHMRTLAA
jgi:hypothetical protein